MSFPGAFFESIVPMLLGGRTAADVERDLGPSPSGTEALAFYAVLARRDVTSVLDRLFVVTKAVAVRVRPGLWDDLVEGYIRTHRSPHWEPNAYAVAFPEYIARRRSDGLDVPRVIEELADFEHARFAVTVSPSSEAMLRQYEHDVRALVRAPSTPLPDPRPTVLAIYRDARHRGVACELGAVELLALARLRGKPVAQSAEVAAAEKRLLALGIT